MFYKKLLLIKDIHRIFTVWSGVLYCSAMETVTVQQDTIFLFLRKAHFITQIFLLKAHICSNSVYYDYRPAHLRNPNKENVLPDTFPLAPGETIQHALPLGHSSARHHFPFWRKAHFHTQIIFSKDSYLLSFVSKM